MSFTFEFSFCLLEGKQWVAQQWVTRVSGLRDRPNYSARECAERIAYARFVHQFPGSLGVVIRVI